MPNSNHTSAKLNEPPTLVETPQSLQRLAEQLAQEPRIAVDTESNSLHAYREEVCLIQFTIPGQDYLVDPLALEHLEPLLPIFASAEIEKIFHAADYDLIVLQRDYGITCGRLFDTMWAGRILGWSHVGLGNILEAHFDVHPNKRYQRYNWGKRPLETEAVRYARMDTHYLLDLRDLQATALQERGRWAEAQEIFDYLCHHVPDPPDLSLEMTFWKIKGMHDLPADEKKVLYQLHLWREATAEKMGRPTFKVISNRRLIKLTRIQPRNRKGLRAAGLTNYQIHRFGKGLLRALRTPAKSFPPYPNETQRAPEHVSERYNALHSWRKQVAAGRGVDSDVILPNATLWELAWHPPETLAALLDVPGFGPWRQQTYGPDILALLETT